MTAAVPSPEQVGWRRPSPTPEQVRTDAFAAVGLFLLSVLSMVLTRAIGPYGADAAAPVVSVGLLAVMTVPLALRRRYPAAIAVLVGVAFIVGGELRIEETIVANIALFCAIYTVGAWQPDRQRALWVRGGLVAVMAIWLVIGMFRIAGTDLGTDGGGIGALTPNVGFMLQNLLINVLYFAGAWWFGDHAWSSARQRAVLKHRTEQLAIEQARVAQQAVVIERLRIARELHDAVAHHVSLMGVQAAAARSILPADVEGAQAQLAALEESARAAVAELYALLGTLRDDDDDTAEPTEAMLGLDGLPRLVSEAEAAGLRISVATVGEPCTVPALIGLNLYRIAQEALTNVIKHADGEARVQLTVRYLDAAIELEIVDDGGQRAVAPASGIGLGLPGMRERVASLLGELVAEPRSTGGFVVRARVPLPGRRTAADAGRDAVAPPSRAAASAAPYGGATDPNGDRSAGADRLAAPGERTPR